MFMPRRTNIIELIGKLIATNKKVGLENTAIICQQSFSILLQVAFLKCSSSEVKISTIINFLKTGTFEKFSKFCVDFSLDFTRKISDNFHNLPTNGAMNGRQKS